MQSENAALPDDLQQALRYLAANEFDLDALVDEHESSVRRLFEEPGVGRSLLTDRLSENEVEEVLRKIVEQDN